MVTKLMQIEDKTLREGQQRSGVDFSVDQKVEVARELDKLGLDYIQIGFPIANDGTKQVIDRLDVDAKLTGTARALKRDIDACLDAGVDVIGFSIPSSDIQREQILGVSREELKEMLVSNYEYCRDHGLPVQVGTMDGFRTDVEFINELIDTVDADRFGISDTVGTRNPWEVEQFLSKLECDLSRIRVHFHCDLGLGTANAVAAAKCGVGTVDVTCGGIGERVGNVPLEEFIVALELSEFDVEHNIATEELIPTTKSILDTLGEESPSHKPILGETAYEHESGMHTAAMIDTPSTFEPFDPSRFGGERRLLFGPASGRGAARRLLQEADAKLTEEHVDEFLATLHNLDENVVFNEAVDLARDAF